MTKQQMKRMIEKARLEGIKKRTKIKMLEYQISFGDTVMDLAYSLN